MIGRFGGDQINFFCRAVKSAKAVKLQQPGTVPLESGHGHGPMVSYLGSLGALQTSARALFRVKPLMFDHEEDGDESKISSSYQIQLRSVELSSSNCHS